MIEDVNRKCGHSNQQSEKDDSPRMWYLLPSCPMQVWLVVPSVMSFEWFRSADELRSPQFTSISGAAVCRQTPGCGLGVWESSSGMQLEVPGLLRTSAPSWRKVSAGGCASLTSPRACLGPSVDAVGVRRMKNKHEVGLMFITAEHTHEGYFAMKSVWESSVCKQLLKLRPRSPWYETTFTNQLLA